MVVVLENITSVRGYHVEIVNTGVADAGRQHPDETSYYCVVVCNILPLLSVLSLSASYVIIASRQKIRN